MDSENADSEHSLIPEVLYEDDTLLVLSKPAGLVVHSDGRTEESSLSEWLRERDASLENVGGQHTLDSGRYLPRFGLLHRIDRETSGVILVAKNDETFYVLQRQFIDRSIEKVYRAFVHGVPNPKEGVINLAIGRSRVDFRQWTTGKEARGTLRPATTEYKVLISKAGVSEVELRPKTGRTHQIRVHMKAIGCPLLSDSRYGSAPVLGFARLALHAHTLTITMPDGKRKTFTSPLTPDFVAAEAILGM
jgi:23S rRNA pseudouridine1911/1915/1917 synthase